MNPSTPESSSRTRVSASPSQNSPPAAPARRVPTASSGNSTGCASAHSHAPPPPGPGAAPAHLAHVSHERLEVALAPHEEPERERRVDRAQPHRLRRARVQADQVLARGERRVELRRVLRRVRVHVQQRVESCAHETTVCLHASTHTHTHTHTYRHTVTQTQAHIPTGTHTTRDCAYEPFVPMKYTECRGVPPSAPTDCGELRSLTNSVAVGIGNLTHVARARGERAPLEYTALGSFTPSRTAVTINTEQPQ